MNYIAVFIGILVGSIVTAPFLWLAGRWVVGSKKAKFGDAVWIGIAGTIVNAVIGVFLGGLLGSFAQILAYLYLIKTYFETGWFNAGVISIVAVFIRATVGAILLLLFGLNLGIGYGY
jgi:hypothetical protein